MRHTEAGDPQDTADDFRAIKQSLRSHDDWIWCRKPGHCQDGGQKNDWGKREPSPVRSVPQRRDGRLAVSDGGPDERDHGKERIADEVASFAEAIDQRRAQRRACY